MIAADYGLSFAAALLQETQESLFILFLSFFCAIVFSRKGAGAQGRKGAGAQREASSAWPHQKFFSFLGKFSAFSYYNYLAGTLI